MKKNFLLALISCTCFSLYAQFDSVIKTAFVRAPNIFFKVTENHLGEDTVLDNQFNYTKPDFNGNLGLPSQEIFLENKLQPELGFKYMTPNYRNHFYTKSDIAYYTTKNPYTRVFALVGQRQEQMLRLVHTQNIKRFNYMVKFNRYKCNGFYNQQTAINDNFISTINYSSKNGRYKLLGSFLYNKLRHSENGGIKDDSAFFAGGYLLNKELFDVNLSKARRSTRNLGAEVTNIFRLNKNDSANKADHFIFYSGGYSGDYFVYQDNFPKAGYYKNVFYDTTLTLDSTHVSKMINQAGYTLQLKGKIKTEFFSAIKNEKVWSRQSVVSSTNPLTSVPGQRIYFDSILSNTMLSSGIHLKPGNSDFIGRAEYVMDGSNKSDYSFNVNYFLPVNWKKSDFSLNVFTENRTQDLFFRSFSSNNFTWKQDFDKRTTTQIFGRLNAMNNIFQVENMTRITGNYIYFDSLLTPKIYTNNILVSRTTVAVNLKLKKIHFNNKMNYQSTNTSAIIRMPSYILQSQLYYDGKLFKNNLHLQVGAQLTYYSAFKSNVYVPATNMYYIQNSTFYGDYPFVDFFINAEIKPVRFFFKLDHINQGLSGPDYMLTPHMPMPDRSFKFGFTWLFWD